jgi:hypothetical protein
VPPRTLVCRSYFGAVQATVNSYDACDLVLATDQMLMEGLTLDLGRRPFKFHVRCFQIWDHERRVA